MDELIVQGEVGRHIFTLRGKQVILDRDLADLYQVKATRLREQVKRNSKRFPEDFMFQLNENEVEIMVSQNAIPSKQHLGGALPYAFTEQGVYMLPSTGSGTGYLLNQASEHCRSIDTDLGKHI